MTVEDEQRKRGSRSVLQVWLGSSQGWSLPVELTKPSSLVAPPPVLTPKSPNPSPACCLKHPLTTCWLYNAKGPGCCLCAAGALCLPVLATPISLTWYSSAMQHCCHNHVALMLDVGMISFLAQCLHSCWRFGLGGKHVSQACECVHTPLCPASYVSLVCRLSCFGQGVLVRGPQTDPLLLVPPPRACGAS